MPERLLEVRALDAHYGDFQALFGVSMAVAEGEVVAVIGANGAGKIDAAQVHRRRHAARARDAIVFDGAPIGDLPAHAMVARGIALVPEGRRLFPSLTVEENLLIGGQLGRPGPWNLRARLRPVPDAARARAIEPAPSLSGGQQQMVAIGRALMSNPRLLLCDEISLGLAPIVIRDIYARLPAIVARGHFARHRRAGHRAGAASRPPRLSACRRAASRCRRGRHARRARKSPPRISGCDVEWLNTIAAGRAARRALRDVRGRPVADLRRHAAGQHRARRPDRARGLRRAGRRCRHSASIRCSRSSSSCR